MQVGPLGDGAVSDDKTLVWFLFIFLYFYIFLKIVFYRVQVGLSGDEAVSDVETLVWGSQQLLLSNTDAHDSLAACRRVSLY